MADIDVPPPVADRAASVERPRPWAGVLVEQLGIVVGYGLVTIALTWPMARDITTRVIGEVHFDSRHAIWVLWYTREAVLGYATWPWTTALHHPYGITLLVDGVGPLNAALAWPFWPLGAAAVYNGSILLGGALSGWSLYALARHVGLDRGAALWAGALFLAWPIHLIATFGHLEKLFVALLPLAVLTALVALDLRRHAAWAIAPALTLLAALLHNGNQFIFAGLAVAVVVLGVFARTPTADRRRLAIRATLVMALSLVACAPMLAAIAQTLQIPGLHVTLGDASFFYSPDLVQLVMPAPHQALARWLYPDDTPYPDFARASIVPILSPRPGWYGSGMETAVNIPFIALALGLSAVALGTRGAASWLAFGSVFACFALGPWLRVFGHGLPDLKIPLPYVLLTKVPGVNVMRVPGRFMMVGCIGFVLAAALGASALRSRAGRGGRLLVTAAMVLALVECWPRVWPQSALPPVPPFYAELARDTGAFAVLDLPHGWHGRSHLASAYMYFQTFHHKPIAWAYLSRYYRRFPVDGLDSLWNDNVTDHRATRDRLLALGYRYVVWHKHTELFEGGRVADGADGVPRRDPTPAARNAFIREAFAGETPVLDDELTTVYAIGRAS